MHDDDGGPPLGLTAKPQDVGRDPSCHFEPDPGPAESVSRDLSGRRRQVAITGLDDDPAHCRGGATTRMYSAEGRRERAVPAGRPPLHVGVLPNHSAPSSRVSVPMPWVSSASTVTCDAIPSGPMVKITAEIVFWFSPIGRYVNVSRFQWVYG